MISLFFCNFWLVESSDKIKEEIGLEELTRQYYEKIQHYFRGKVRDAFQVEDLVQDVF